MRRPRFIKNYGRAALLLEWEQRIHPPISQSVHAYAHSLSEVVGVTECIPAYASLLVRFLPEVVSGFDLRETIYELTPTTATHTGITHQIPVCYGGQYGPDLAEVARSCADAKLSNSVGRSLTESELIELHTQPEYLIYMLGFLPGFAFMGELDERLATPRRATPRSNVTAGSVGIAGRQTGIYPSASPGGWQLLGRCPLPLLRSAEGISRFRPGDRVKFHAISEEEFVALQKNPDRWPKR